MTGLLLGAILLMSSNGGEEEKGIIGRVYEGEFPVIYKFVNELPSKEIRSQLSWLMIISWKYDGTTNNGMPTEAVNNQMIILEDAIENHIEKEDFLQHAYSRTGNNLKELVFYIHDQDQFLEKFNIALKDQPRFPIEIAFYLDEKWEDFQRLLDDFSDAAK